jgi:hypothetical protein
MRQNNRKLQTLDASCGGPSGSSWHEGSSRAHLCFRRSTVLTFTYVCARYQETYAPQSS